MQVINFVNQTPSIVIQDSYVILIVNAALIEEVNQL